MTDRLPMNDLVIVLPGIMGSILAKHGRPIWEPSLGALARALQREALVNDLMLVGDDPERDVLDDGVTATALMPDVRIIPGFWKIDGYSDFLNHLKATFALTEGNPTDPQPDANFFPFPYDWRRDNRGSARRLKVLVDKQLPRWRERSGNPDARTIFIAHSMGGLVASYYLEVLGGWEYCRALITLGTPFRGSVNALNSLCEGVSLLPWIDVNVALRSYTTAYQLLPLYPVIERDGQSFKITDVTGLPHMDPARVQQALTLFHQPIASAADQRERGGHANAYRVFPTVGIQQPTRQAAVLTADGLKMSYERPQGLVQRNIPGFGDGTVPYYAALPVISLAQPFFIPHGHGALQNSAEVRRQIDQCLQLLQVDPAALDAVSFAPPQQPGLRLLVEDAYSTQGGRISVQAVDADPGAVTLRLVAVDEAGQSELVREMAREGADWVYDLEAPRAGVYRVTIEPANRDQLRPLQDLFEVVGAPVPAGLPLPVAPPAGTDVRPAVPAAGHAERLQALAAEVREIQARLGRLADQLAALAPALGAPQPDSQPPEAPSLEGDAPADDLPDEDPMSLSPEAAKESELGFQASGATLLFQHTGAPPTELLPVNGIDLTTGKYLLEIDSAAVLAAASAAPDSQRLTRLHESKQKSASQKEFGTVFGVNEDSIEQSRWALVVNGSEDPAVLAALTPLIRYRAEQQGITLKEEHLRFMDAPNCGAWYYSVTTEAEHRAHWRELPPILIYRNGESVARWLSRHNVTQGPVDPARGVPFYLALAGRPGALSQNDTAYIPFGFQYQLDLYWGVGRICFTDSSGRHRLRGYRDYAERLVEIERRSDAAERLAREVVYFGTRHADDRATGLSATQLISPLYNWHAENSSTGPGVIGFERRLFLEADATRNNLETLLRGSGPRRPPAILFTATHGAGLPLGHADLVAHQGALICQEWGGGPVAREQYFTGSDLGTSANVEGMVAVLFACFGGGSPAEDQFLFDEGRARPGIAPFPFIAQFPQQLLSNGALAVLSHIDRAWTYSFSSGDVPAQSQNYEDLLSRIVRGKRLGFATDQFNVMQSSRAMNLADELENIKFGKRTESFYVSMLWMARNDARNFALLGDPAVRLPFGPSTS